MTADQQTDRNEELLGRLISSLIDNPREMDLQGYRMIERVNFSVGVGINDYGKLAGKMGAHAKALRVVAARMGEKISHQYFLRTVPPSSLGRVKPVRTEPAVGYDCREAHELLADVLGAILDSPPAIKVEKSDGQADMAGFEVFNFTVRPTAIQDEATLLDQFELGRGETMSLIAALGTLFRAYGRREGVSFVIGCPSQ